MWNVECGCWQRPMHWSMGVCGDHPHHFTIKWLEHWDGCRVERWQWLGFIADTIANVGMHVIGCLFAVTCQGIYPEMALNTLPLAIYLVWHCPAVRWMATLEPLNKWLWGHLLLYVLNTSAHAFFACYLGHKKVVSYSPFPPAFPSVLLRFPGIKMKVTFVSFFYFLGGKCKGHWERLWLVLP